MFNVILLPKHLCNFQGFQMKLNSLDIFNIKISDPNIG